MDAREVLASMRTLVLVVNSDATIDAAYGGFGGFLGLDLQTIEGSSVFEHVVPEDIDDLATYFLESVGESTSTIAVPMPFRMRVAAPDGLVHQVDVIPTGINHGVEDWQWIAEIVPVSLFGSTTRSLDLVTAGAPREDVCRMLCEELAIDNVNYTSRWFLVDLADPSAPTVVTSRADDEAIVEALRGDFVDGSWRPWAGLGAGTTESVDPATIPTATKREMDARGWQRAIVSPIFVRGRLVGAFILAGRVPPEYQADYVKANVAARIQNLVRTTALLFERWEDQDRLEIAASTDALTGLVNRRTLFSVLDNERRSGALVFIDVDDFKTVNDTCGHEVGDRVLIEVARRIKASCRDHDVVARVGGDEFVVLLQGADAPLAAEICDRISDEVRHPLNIDGGPLQVSVSVGHALVGERSARQALDAADNAMLGAKRTGRRTVALASYGA